MSEKAGTDVGIENWKAGCVLVTSETFVKVDPKPAATGVGAAKEGTFAAVVTAGVDVNMFLLILLLNAAMLSSNVSFVAFAFVLDVSMTKVAVFLVISSLSHGIGLGTENG